MMNTEAQYRTEDRPGMKKRLMWLAALVLAAGSGYAQETVSLAEGRVSFEVPAGFRQLTSEEIALKYPSGNRPGYAYANGRADVSISIRVLD